MFGSRDAIYWRHGGRADHAVTAAAAVSSARLLVGRWRTIRVPVQMLTLSPNLALLDALSGLFKMRCIARLAFSCILASTKSRLGIMPKPICTTFLILFEVFDIHALEVLCALRFLSFAFPLLAIRAGIATWGGRWC